MMTTPPLEKVSDVALRQTLAVNAAFAKANVARFCELAGELAGEPLFKPLQGTRDATGELSRLFGVMNVEEQRRISLPVEVRRSLMNGSGLELTEEQLTQIDFGWMRRMRDFDRLTGELETPDPWSSRAYAPAPKFPNYFVRLRLLRAAKIGDWEDAAKDIEAFATLLHTSGSTRVDGDATGVLALKLQTLAQLKEAGVEVPTLPLPSAQKVKLHAALVGEAFRFVAPGVALEVQLQAFECARRAGFECAAAFESASISRHLRSAFEASPPAFETARCNAYQRKAINGEDDWGLAPAAENARLREPSAHFGD